MNNVFLLTKILFKNGFLSQFSFAKKNTKKKKGKVWILFLTVLLLFSVLPIAYASSEFVKELPIISEIIISIMVPAMGFVIFIFGLFSMFSMFFVNDDSQFLLSLPIKGRDLLISKFFVGIISIYFILLILFAPIFIGVGVGMSYGVLYFLYLVLFFAIAPIIPSVIMSFLLIFLMGFLNLAKFKNIFTYVFTFIILGVSFSYSFAIRLFDNGGGVEENLNLLEPVKNLSSRIFPFFNPAGDALLNYSNIEGFFSIVFFASLSLLFLMSLYIFGDKPYMKALLKTEIKNKKNVEYKNVYKIIKNRNVIFEYLKRDWIVIKRTPIYMLNLIVVLFIFPIILLFSFSTSEMTNFISGEIIETQMGFLIAYGSIIFILSTSAISATSISREGSSAWFLKVLPNRPLVQIFSKTLLGIFINLILIFILGVVSYFLLNFNVYYLVILFLTLIGGNILINIFGILIDLKRPSLNWISETEAVKQNLNVLFYMMFSILYVFIIAGVYYLLDEFALINEGIASVLILINLFNSILISFLIYYVYKLDKKGKLLNNIY